MSKIKNLAILFISAGMITSSWAQSPKADNLIKTSKEKKVTASMKKKNEGFIKMNANEDFERWSYGDEEPYLMNTVTKDDFAHRQIEVVLGSMRPGEKKEIKSYDEFHQKFRDARQLVIDERNAARPKTSDDKSTDIGVATMDEKGILTLHLRSMDHGMLAEANKVVRPGDSEYKEMVKHLNGIKPGESKAIPPFPDKNK